MTMRLGKYCFWFFLMTATVCAVTGAGGCVRDPASNGVTSPTSGVATGSVTSHEQREEPDKRLELTDWTSQSGIDFVHNDGSSGKRFIMETVSCGLAIFDYDGDGLSDVYLCNGAALPGTPPLSPPSHHALYKNLGGMKFCDVTREAGVACQAFGLGITVGDFDNDGHPDIYLSNYGSNVLYRNDGDGTFTDVTDAAGVGRGERVGAGTCLLDMDGDGDLDLFAANYVRFSLAAHQAPKQGGRSVYPGPLDYPAEHNTLFRNEGDGRWTDVSGPSGIAVKAGTGMGAVCGDIDGDGDTDICVANDEMANFLYRNNGHGTFEETGIFSGVAYDGMGAARGSMGIDCGDFDNDGRLDLYVTAYQHERATLYRNLGDAFFHDVTQLTGAGDGTAPNVSWGCCLADLDNDGDRDLYVACGHLDERDDNTVYNAPDVVLKNQLAETGEGRFINISDRCGNGPRLRLSSRGAAIDDLDNDGDLDVIVLNSRERASILKNQLQDRSADHHWLQVRLRGTTTNRDGVGAQVRLVVGDLVLVDEVHSGRGYQSYWGGRLHFGLGPRKRVDRIEVRWIGGGTDVLEDIAVDQVLTLFESVSPTPVAPNPSGAGVK